ncbi:hypothetical protein E1B28_006918 [Marasmius oreades]|uniref:Uncharacterized protein n=1 Tax=Marasmius oreades TaxID=181124 RepID=A0A9P7S170_9AGAR|nr:uncharacterized protein E1B28_006918 [Marasmius oreades]KAG7093232.1 hypothetical protein E1B28_006918 [Marasmius oreades]
MNTTNIAILIGISMKSIPVIYRFGLVFPLIVVNNSLVCYVFRSVGTAAAAARYQEGRKESLPVFRHPFSQEDERSGGPLTRPVLMDGSDTLCLDRVSEENTRIGMAL